MLRTLLLFIVFFSGAVLSQQPPNPVQQTNAQSAPNSSEEDSPQQIIITFPEELISIDLAPLVEQIKAMSTNLQPDIDAQQRLQENERESLNIGRADLVKQKSMAKGTWAIFWTAVVGLVISAIGIILLVMNLNLTNKIIRQDRAWMSIGNPESYTHKAFKDGTTSMTDRVQVKEVGITDHILIENVGKSPALKVMSIVKEFTSPPTGSDLRGVKASLVDYSSVSIVGPSHSLAHTIEFTPERFKSILSKPEYIYICCQYETIYDEVFMLEWCSEIVIQKLTNSDDEQGGFAYKPFGNFDCITRIGKYHEQIKDT